MEFLSEAQINEIRETSVTFPIFFAEKGNIEKITEGLSITDLGSSTIMGVPEFIELERYKAGGLVTIARYQLVESYKSHEKNFIHNNPPEDN